MKTNYAFGDGRWCASRFDDDGVLIDRIGVYITAEGKFSVENETDTHKEIYKFLRRIKKSQNRAFDTLADAKNYIEKLPTPLEIETAFSKLVDVVKDSDGVAEWHKNGEIATWADLGLSLITEL